MSHSQPPPSGPSPTILLFARGVLALLDLWPALTIAVKEEWGGPESQDKKTWLASTLIDEFESRATYLPACSVPTTSNEGPSVDPSTANDPPLDHDDLADLLNQMMSDEFDANIEDGSVDAVAADIVRLWRDILRPPVLVGSGEGVVGALERKAAEVRRSGVKVQKGEDMVEVESGEESDGGDADGNEGMEVDGEEASRLVRREREREERKEPEVDEDGFTTVTKGRRR